MIRVILTFALYVISRLGAQFTCGESAKAMGVNPVVVRNEIEPLLSALIRELAAQGRATERAIYSGIRDRLRRRP